MPVQSEAYLVRVDLHSPTVPKVRTPNEKEARRYNLHPLILRLLQDLAQFSFSFPEMAPLGARITPEGSHLPTQEPADS